MQILLCQCALLGHSPPFLLGNLKEHVRVWLLTLEDKEQPAWVLPMNLLLGTEFLIRLSSYTLGMLQGPVKLHGKITKALFKYTEKWSLSFMYCQLFTYLEIIVFI